MNLNPQALLRAFEKPIDWQAVQRELMRIAKQAANAVKRLSDDGAEHETPHWQPAQGPTRVGLAWAPQYPRTQSLCGGRYPSGFT